MPTLRLGGLSLSLLAVLLSLPLMNGVDRSKFRTCAQSAFCGRGRNAAQLGTFALDPETLKASDSRIQAVLWHSGSQIRYRFELQALKDGTFRVGLREAFPLVPRFEVPNVLVDEAPEGVALTLDEQKPEGFTATTAGTGHRVRINNSPFRVAFFAGEKLRITLNARDLLHFEATREKPTEAGEGQEAVPEEPGMWEESFGGNTDSKPHGAQAVGLDFTFHGSEDIFGVPEHADKFNLPDTGSTDPIRLYNLDVFEYELDNPMALYAAVPMVMSQTAEITTGAFWLNAAETWVDVSRSGSGVLGSLSNLVTQGEKSVNIHFLSESGVLDTFIFLGPRPHDVSRQYGQLTGNTPLPPAFSLAYHQCRWNYNDQDDVKMVSDKFDEHDIPMDIMWLDIEHTDAKKYFTWDGRKFPNSLEMIQNLTAVGRKLVTIVDPHIKKDSNYWVHKELTDLGLYVKTKEGNDYEGWCWPGASYYPDFLNPAAREYFAQQYALDKYQGTTKDVFTWNDMNEPSVFNGPEVTMPKDLIHHGNVEHRDLHNMYGHLYIMGTFDGHILRSEGKQRPFILTRSAFAGSQRYAAIWTGDNTAEWGHLAASVPMCLSLSIAGISFCGADVGGFFGNPDGELFVRWYQTAAFQPFFRSHAHIDTKRREPWLFNESEMKLIRNAIRTRYSYLPLWYTLFYENEMTSVPPMRPVWYDFPTDVDAFTVEDEFMVGTALLVHPVAKSGASHVNVHFPGREQYWYDVLTHERIDHEGSMNIPVKMDHIPVYQRGGSIIPKKERIRRSSALMHDDPITLMVALDKDGKANGTLYIDDGISYEYRTDKKSLYMQFVFDGQRLSGHQMHTPGYQTGSWLERVVFIGIEKEPTGAKLISPSGKEEILGVQYEARKKLLTVRKPGVNMAEDWEIVFQY